MAVSGRFRILRRLTGAIGAFAGLYAGELFHNETDDTLYVGKGDDGAGNSTAQKAVGGVGAFVDKASAQTIAGVKTLGDPAATDPTIGDNSGNSASTAFVATAVAGLAPLASPALTGSPTAPTQTAGDSSTKLSTTSFVGSAVSAAVAPLAPKASPTFTGTVTIPTPAAGDSSTAAASTAFVQSAVATIAQGLQAKPTARLATAAALPGNAYSNGVLTAAANGALSVDGVAVAAADIVLVKNETAPANNGLYTVTNAGGAGAPYVLTRHVNMDTSAEVPNAYIIVGSAGATQGNSFWTCNPTTPFTLGTTAIPFTQLNGATDLLPGSLVTISGNTIAINGGAALTAGTLLKYDGTKLVVAIVGTDYVAPGSTYDAGTA